MIKFDIHVQRQVIWFGLDDCSPTGMLPNLHGGQDGATPGKWRESVISLTCRLLDAGLIVPLPGIEKYEDKSSDYLKSLLINGDPANGFDVDLVWNIMYFDGTEKLIELLRKFSLNNWDAMKADLSVPLGEALADLEVVRL